VDWELAWSSGLPAALTIWPRLMMSNGTVMAAPGRQMVVKGPPAAGSPGPAGAVARSFQPRMGTVLLL
jgi:hypothetical protein